MIPQIIAKIRFSTSEEGGRIKPISGDVYGCPMLIDDEFFDCRMLLSNRVLELGKSYQVSIAFLSAEIAMKKLVVGARFKLWEGKIIGSGKVSEILNR